MTSDFLFKHSSTSVILRFPLYDSSVTTGAFKTGMDHTTASLSISTVASSESSATNYTSAGSTLESITTLGTYATPTATKARFKESPISGIYELQLADARFAVSNAEFLTIVVSGATNLKPQTITVRLSALDIDTSTVTVGSISADAITSTAIQDGALTGAKFASDGSLQSATSTTAVLATSASSTNDLYNYALLKLTGGTGAGQTAVITDYVGSTRTATTFCLGGASGAWVTTPDNTTTYDLVAWVDPLRVIVETQGSYTAQQVLSILLSESCGVHDSDGVFKSPNGSSTRISGTVDANGLRSSITLTPSS